MDDELKTFGGVSEDNTIKEPPMEDSSLSTVDPLLVEQQNQVDQMRSTLLSFNKCELNSAKRAIQNITVLRIYHQIARIIRFTDMMDRLEDKLYDSIDMSISGMDSADPTTMLMLLKVQSQLQETMIQSQLLIKPYLDMDITSIAPQQEMEETSFGATIISQSARSNIRTGAQAVLTALKNANPELQTEDSENTEAVPNPETVAVEEPDVRNISTE